MSSSWRLRSPDWETLGALVDAVCQEQGLLTKSGTPNYHQLAGAVLAENYIRPESAPHAIPQVVRF